MADPLAVNAHDGDTAGMAIYRVPTPAPPAVTAHEEKHFASTALVRDVVIGMSDGLTVPFAGGGNFRRAFVRCGGAGGAGRDSRRIDRHGPGRLFGRTRRRRAL